MALRLLPPSHSRPPLPRFWADLRYVLSGFPMAIVSFPVLVIMTTMSVATLAVWLGVLLMPPTLMLASTFARLSKQRYLVHGGTLEPVQYREFAPGVFGRIRIISDPRRWLDLAFEALIAVPVRVTTSAVTVGWIFMGLGGLSYGWWSSALPRAAAQNALDIGIAALIGGLFLVTLPIVVAWLAHGDALLVAALLGSDSPGAEQTVGKAAPERSFSPTAWSRAGAGFAAMALLAVGWPVLVVLYGLDMTEAMVWVGLHCAAIVVALRWSWSGLVLSLVASGVLLHLTESMQSTAWPWPVTVLLTQCAVLSVLGFVQPWYFAISGWSASVVVTIATLVTTPSLPDGAIGNSSLFVSVSAAVVAASTLGRTWIRNAGKLQAAERASMVHDRRTKELAERNRIARELHDVVAHSMSVISVQAATARYRHPEIGATAQQEFKEIADSSRQALGEMRLLLNILRNEDDAPTAPTPNLSDLDALVETTRASGTLIHYRGLPQDHSEMLQRIPPATALAAYRTVQEALSNALRHAPGAAVTVELTVEPENTVGRALCIAVTNDLPRGPVRAVPGSGLGLTGIAERTAAVGGTVQTGPTSDGKFAVRARLPIDLPAPPHTPVGGQISSAE